MPTPTPGPDQEPHWLTVATRGLAYFALLGDQNARWREKAEETVAALGWSRADVARILRGCDAEQAKMREAGTLAAAIAASTFPKASHVFARGFTAPWIHATDGASWAEWAYKRWAITAASAPVERFADRIARKRREDQEYAAIQRVEALA